MKLSRVCEMLSPISVDPHPMSLPSSKQGDFDEISREGAQATAFFDKKARPGRAQLFWCPANCGSLRHGFGLAPVYVIQRLSSNMFDPGAEKSRISAPTGLMAGLAAETSIGGLPMITFFRMTFPVGVAVGLVGNSARPLMLPPIPFSSMMLPLLEPTSPTPKSLGIGPGGGPGAMVPFPTTSLRRTRLLLLLVTQTPPHGRASELAEFLAETTSSTRVLFTKPMKMPLKQFWYETSFFTTDLSTGWNAVPMSAIPCRLILSTSPGPSITTSLNLLWMPSASFVGNWLAVTHIARGGSLAGPVILNPLSSSLIPGAPNWMHGPLSVCKHWTSQVSRLLWKIVNVVGTHHKYQCFAR